MSDLSWPVIATCLDINVLCLTCNVVVIRRTHGIVRAIEPRPGPLSLLTF